MSNYRVNLGFVGLPDGQLDELTSKIISGMNGNAAFPNPPIPLTPSAKAASASKAKVALLSDVTEIDLTTLQTNFRESVKLSLDGGMTLTAAKNAAKNALVTGLRSLAAYVQSIASQDLALLLTSGFTANSTNRAQNKLNVPIILTVENVGTTKLGVRLQPVDNARAYQVRGSTGTNGTTTTLPIIDSTQSRQIVVENLVPGTTYTFQARAVGGSEGYSEWSDPISHMAT